MVIVRNFRGERTRVGRLENVSGGTCERGVGGLETRRRGRGEGGRGTSGGNGGWPLFGTDHWVFQFTLATFLLPTRFWGLI